MAISKASLLCLLAGSFVLADQITLKNGDRISGTVIKKDGDKLTVKNDFMGEVTLPWNAVTSVKSDAPLTVVLPTGAQVNGKVSTEGNTLEVETPTRSATAPIGQVNAIRNSAEEARYQRLLHPGWLDLWAGYADLGFALARGNARTTTLTTAFAADRVTNNDKTSIFFNQIYATARINNINAATANAARGGISYDHNISPRWFYTLETLDEYDNFQNLDFRGIGGGGIGFHAIKTERTLLDLSLGGDYAHEAYSTGVTRNLAEVNAGDDLSYKLSGIASLTQSFRIFEAPQNGQYRMNFDLGMATTIRKWLSWQVTASDRFLSNPVFGRKRNDVLLTTGVRATFSHGK